MNTQNSSKERILSLVDKKKEELFSLASKLVQIPSVNPPADMTEIAEFIMEFLNDCGVQYTKYESEKGKISIIATLKGSTGDNTLCFNGHMDVVPVGDIDKWTYNPFSGKIVNGYLYGRGSSDMKGGVAAQLITLKILSELNLELNGSLSLNLVPDEETGSRFGTKWLFENGKIHCDACIIGEPSGLKAVNIGSKGKYWIYLKVLGEPAHGSMYPYLGDNAIIRACKIIQEILKIRDMKVTYPEELTDIVEDSKMLAEADFGVKGIGEIIKRPTVNIGVIKGGRKINIVADSCNVEIDIRIPIGLTSDDIENRVNQIFKSVGNKKIEADIKKSNPTYTSPNSKIAKIVKKNSETVLGEKTYYYLDFASSDAKYYREHGIPTVLYGPHGIRIHSYNERVSLNELVYLTKVYLSTALDYLS